MQEVQKVFEMANTRPHGQQTRRKKDFNVSTY